MSFLECRRVPPAIISPKRIFHSDPKNRDIFSERFSSDRKKTYSSHCIDRTCGGKPTAFQPHIPNHTPQTFPTSSSRCNGSRTGADKSTPAASSRHRTDPTYHNDQRIEADSGSTAPNPEDASDPICRSDLRTAVENEAEQPSSSVEIHPIYHSGLHRRQKAFGLHPRRIYVENVPNYTEHQERATQRRTQSNLLPKTF